MGAKLKKYKFVGINSNNERFKGIIYGTSVLDVMQKLRLDADILSIINVEVDRTKRRKKKKNESNEDSIDTTKINMEKINVKDRIANFKEGYNRMIASIKNAKLPSLKNKIVIISKDNLPKNFLNNKDMPSNNNLMDEDVFNDNAFIQPSVKSYYTLEEDEMAEAESSKKDKVVHKPNAIKNKNKNAPQETSGLQKSITEKLLKSVEVKKKKVAVNISDINYIEIKDIKRVKIKDLVDFSKKMEILLTSDILLVDALIIVRESVKNKYFRKVINNIIFSINSGQSLSDSMVEYPEIFDSFYVSTIVIGESVGALKESFKDLYITYKNRLVINKKIKTASIYPSITLIVLLLMMVLGSKLLLPKLKDLFVTSGIKLPALTQFVFSAADNLGNILIVGAILSIVGFFVYKFVPKLNKLSTFFLNIISLKLPLIGRFKTYVELYNFSTTMHIMIKNGMGLVDSLELSKRVVNNFVYKKQIDLVKNDLLTGKNFAELLAQYDFFDLFTSSMARVGEESGDLENSFNNIVLYHQENIKEMADLLMELVQPVMTLLMAGVAGPVLIAIYMPLLTMMSGNGIQ